MGIVNDFVSRAEVNFSLFKINWKVRALYFKVQLIIS